MTRLAVSGPITSFGRVIAVRLAHSAATLVLASLTTFLLLRLAPGDPVTMMLGARASDPEAVASLRERFYLDQPVLTQYWIWLTNTFRGDLGESFLYRGDVSDLIAARIPTTAVLVLYGSILVIGFGFALGLLAARSPRFVDTGVSAFLSVALATPSYVIAIVLITIFSLHLNWFPVFGSGDGILDRIYHLTLPAVTLALSSSAAVARITRASIIDESRRDHVTTAIARGFAPRDVLWRHIIRNAILPIVTIAGINVAALIAGTVIVEKAYGLDGIGSLLVLAVTRKDYNVVQSVSFLVIAVFLIVNTCVDLLYAAIDPRIRVAR